MWESILSSESFWGLVSALVTLSTGLLFKWLRKLEVEKDAVDTLRVAVARVHDDYVIFLKRAAEDGKLSEEERKEARTRAVDEALDLAKGPVLKLLVAWGKPRLEGLIARIVQGSK